MTHSSQSGGKARSDLNWGGRWVLAGLKIMRSPNRCCPRSSCCPSDHENELTLPLVPSKRKVIPTKVVDIWGLLVKAVPLMGLFKLTIKDSKYT